MLVQQTGKFLLKAITGNFETCEFLKSPKVDKPGITTPDLIQLVDQRAKEKVLQVAALLQKQPDLWDSLQGIYVKDMVEAYTHSYLVHTFTEFLKSISCDKVRSVFEKLLKLYLNERVIKDGGYFKSYLSQDQFNEVKDSTNELLEQLRPDAIALTDILPFPN